MRRVADQPTVRPGVAAVVLDPQNRVLLHRRRIGNGWAPPSGAIEPGESVHEALSRELREETGLGVHVERLVGVYSDPSFQVVQYPDGRRTHFITCLFRCRAETSAISGSEEGLAWEWFAREALPTDLLPYARRWLDDALSDRRVPVVR